MTRTRAKPRRLRLLHVILTRMRGSCVGRFACRILLLFTVIIPISTALGVPGFAADIDLQEARERLTQHYWSQIYPNRDYLDGCLTGYRAFVFDKSGYFVFDRKTHGTWRVDRLGNLVLRTREGEVFRLSRVGENGLRPPNADFLPSFLARNQVFQRCTD
jgi:hypothetical protein